MKMNKVKENLGRGPIGRSVIAFAQECASEKITSINEIRNAEAESNALLKTVISNEDLQTHDPLHAIYLLAQNQLSVLMEEVSALPMLDKLTKMLIKAGNKYVPNDLIIPPITKTFYSGWSNFDFIFNEKDKETLSTIAIDLYQFISNDKVMIEFYENMQKSYMGIYRVERVFERFVFLTELITEKEIKAIVPSGHIGEKGEIWYVRIFPSPVTIKQFDYSMVYNTPYVLGKNKASTENEWLNFFDRNLPKPKIQNRIEAYEYLMKYGLSRNYWIDFIQASYRPVFRNEVIFLEGVPDIR